jgi:hypothetical protein
LEEVTNDMGELTHAFNLIDTEHLAALLAPGIFTVVDQVMSDDVRAVRAAKGIPTVPRVYEAVLRTRTQALLKRVLDRIFKNDPTAFVDFRTLLASAAAVQEQSSKTLMRRVGRFVGMSGFIAGAAAVLLQLVDYLILPQAWTVAVVVAAVAAEVGLLVRQEGHLRRAAQAASSRLLGSRLLWRELSSGSRSSALTAVITQELKADRSFLIYNTAATGSYREFAVKIREALPAASVHATTYVDSVLDSDSLLRRGLLEVNSNFAACIL